MRPTERCGGRGQAPGTAGQTRESTASLTEHAEVGKQAVSPFLPLGACANCGIRIRLTGGITTCPTCTAWRRWYVAHRIASRYLREAMR